ncbi:MAG TPA: metallophosphoesterase [Terriglobales bacterium]
MSKSRLFGQAASGLIEHDHNNDGINRRGFLKCMAWAGAGAVCLFEGGVIQSFALGSSMDGTHAQHHASELSFVQISDSHMGFNKPANPDVVGTLQAAVEKIKALPNPPEFLLHTGDITHLSKPEQFDTVDQILKATNKEIFFVPGEHDVLNDNGAAFRERYGKHAKGSGWYSFDSKGVHFIGLVNVLDLKAGGLGFLGGEQLEWLKDDVRHLKASVPIVVFAHIPLWSVYPEWGWGTDDSAQALSYLKKFGSVTVLNGHIHQTMQKVEGNITFHTAYSTAFPQPAPGQADGPGPMKVPAEQLKSVLGITNVNYLQGRHALALVDSTLA